MPACQHEPGKEQVALKARMEELRSENFALQSAILTCSMRACRYDAANVSCEEPSLNLGYLSYCFVGMSLSHAVLMLCC